MQSVPTRVDRIFLFLLLFLLPCLTAGQLPAARGAGLRIIYSNDVHGELEPCG